MGGGGTSKEIEERTREVLEMFAGIELMHSQLGRVVWDSQAYQLVRHRTI
jgi:hypothetical protein